ncbi:MAG: J domain-containing protein [Deltaproteobacteria bacterium]|nr:J domain-containing protein [Deltaproteobacteria bacterium]
MKRITFEKIDAARKVLELEEEASSEEIKKAYRGLSKRYHPDHCQQEEAYCEEMIRKINQAYEVITAYIHSYKYSFRKEEVQRNDPHHVMGRFYEDWMWGPGQ